METKNLNQNQPPKTWLLESILATLFCCLPLGIIGIINAAKVESRFKAGDIEGAKQASKQAGKWTKAAFWLGLVFAILYFMLAVLAEANG